MKNLKTLPILLMSLLACTSNEAQQRSDHFIKISPNAGVITLMSEMGAFGQDWSTEIYFINFISERELDKKMKHGFIVLKLKRTHKDENKAYAILDQMNGIKRAERADISENSAWDDTKKKEIIATREKAWWTNQQIDAHVKVYVEPEAFETGISENGYLVYE